MRYVSALWLLWCVALTALLINTGAAVSKIVTVALCAVVTAAVTTFWWTGA